HLGQGSHVRPYGQAVGTVADGEVERQETRPTQRHARLPPPVRVRGQGPLGRTGARRPHRAPCEAHLRRLTPGSTPPGLTRLTPRSSAQAVHHSGDPTSPSRFLL